MDAVMGGNDRARRGDQGLPAASPGAPFRVVSMGVM
jgi:hypothetical protein